MGGPGAVPLLCFGQQGSEKPFKKPNLLFFGFIWFWVLFWASDFFI